MRHASERRDRRATPPPVLVTDHLEHLAARNQRFHVQRSQHGQNTDTTRVERVRIVLPAPLKPRTQLPACLHRCVDSLTACCPPGGINPMPGDRTFTASSRRMRWTE